MLTETRHKFPMLSGGGESGSLIRSINWSSRPIGPYTEWPSVLQATLRLILDNPFPGLIIWGSEYTQFYNDAFRPILGITKHPYAMGNSARETYAEIWDTIEPLFKQVHNGNAVRINDLKLYLDRNGKPEECHFDFAYSPIRLEDGSVGGILVTVIETSAAVKLLEQYEFALEAAELATWDLDPITGTFIANQRLHDWFGIPGSGPVKLEMAINQVAESDRERVAAEIGNALNVASGGQYDISYSIVSALTGQLRMLRAKGKATFNSEGKAIRLNGTLEDITLERSAQLALRESEENFRRLLDHAPVAMCLLTGSDHIVELVNEKMLSLWGRTSEEVIGKPIFKGLPEAANQGLEELLANVYNTRERFTAFERAVELPRESGLQTIYQNFVYEPFIGSSGDVTGIIAVTIDVTEQVLARKSVETAEARARLAAEAGRLGTFDYDIVAGQVITSVRLREIFDVSIDDEHSDLVERIHPDDLAVRAAAHALAMETGRLSYECRIVMEPLRWVSFEGQVFYDANGKPVRMLGTVQDITDLKTLEQKREEYIAIVSHELRNPLTSLKLTVDILSQPATSPALTPSLLQRATAQVKRILTMTNSLLNVSKISAGHLELKPEIMRLDDCINESILTFQAGMEKNPITVEGKYIVNLVADKFRIEQVLINLLSNASKYSPTGAPIIIRVDLEESFVRIEVRDRGIGIDREKVPTIFKKFSRVDSSSNIEGYGLGLYISAEIIHKHGGQIGLESEKGQGSVFWFTLPR